MPKPLPSLCACKRRMSSAGRGGPDTSSGANGTAPLGPLAAAMTAPGATDTAFPKRSRVVTASSTASPARTRGAAAMLAVGPYPGWGWGRGPHLRRAGLCCRQAGQAVAAGLQ